VALFGDISFGPQPESPMHLYNMSMSSSISKGNPPRSC
jgi:hypothetical protein